jgi:hypothetical protein
MAWALIVYGVLGLMLVVGGAVVGLDAAGRVERLTVTAGNTLDAAARSTRAAAESFTSIDSSLSEAGASADAAAVLAREAGATLDSLALAMQLSVFGAQPLISLADEFASSADQAVDLADQLDSVGGSLGDTRTDVAVIGVELDTLSRELEALEGSGAGDGGSPPLRLVIGLLLAWLAMPAVGAIVFGLALLRGTRPAPPEI